MDLIFVQIASYRDTDLPNTIKSALEHAEHPQRLRFGICWQYDDLTYTDLDPYLRDARFRVAQYYYEDSRGCCWARNQTNRLYQGEEYTLQIDAHTRFSPKWDSRYLSMLKSIDSPKPLLTTYPAPFSNHNGTDELKHDRGVQRLVLSRVRRNLTARLKTEVVEDDTRCVPSRFVAAGQIFTLGRFCQEVEYDPDLYFSAEEIALAVRAFTHGFDFFCPNEDIIWHRYKHEMRTHWADHDSGLDRKELKRLNTLLLGDHERLGKYGLGRHRSLSDFERHTGISFKESASRRSKPVRFQRRIELDVSRIEDRNDYLFWVFTLNNIDEMEIFRHDIHDRKILSKDIRFIDIDEYLEDEPASYMLWPYVEGAGYLEQYHIDF